MRCLLRTVRVGQASCLSVVEKRPAGCLSYLAVVFSVSLLTGCGTPQEKPKVLVDVDISNSKVELIQVAFDAASAMPLKPHIKDRARAQERVVDACFKLDQPVTALKYIDQIPNWRRGLGYANYAFYSVEHGVTNNIDVLLQKAESIGKVATQEWRTEKVLNRVRQVKFLLSNSKSSEFETKSENSDSGFESEFNKIDVMVSTGEMEALQSAMGVGCSLYKQYYSNDELRTRVKDKLSEFQGRLPVFFRLQYMSQMVHAALDHKDQQEAHRLVLEIGRFISDNTWPAQYHVKALADLASLQSECGDNDAAFESLSAARDLYIQSMSAIINIDRTDTLIPVAEAALALNKPAMVSEIYELALNASLENPNSRPRADDLVLICVSMALHAVDPDEALWKQIHEIKDGLGDPW